jgi:hypothetical protein
MAPTKQHSACPSCESYEVLSVALRLSDAPFHFTFCTRCEWKSWRHEGEMLPLTSVLNLVASH